MLDFFLTIGLYSSVVFVLAVVLTNIFEGAHEENDTAAPPSTPTSTPTTPSNPTPAPNPEHLQELLNKLEIPVSNEKPSIAFITLTNNAYHHFTLNCLRSLKFLRGPQLHTYCIGNDCAKQIQCEGFPVTVIDTDEELSQRQIFRKGRWGELTNKKLHIIHRNLKENDYVCYTDSDIVFCKAFWDYLLYCIGNNDMLIQNDTMEDGFNGNLCSGFMFIKKNDRTMELFDPANTNNRINEIQFDDQAYINEIKHKLDFQLLPLDLFPNGKYFYNNSDKLDPMMIHFNWSKDKQQAMRNFGYWNNF